MKLIKRKVVKIPVDIETSLENEQTRTRKNVKKKKQMDNIVEKE